MNSKHAYLIMAHGNWSILKLQLQLLDDPRNDIYLHIDRKVKDFDFESIKKICKYSNLFFTPKRIDVRWGESSQVKTEMLLFKTAVSGRYAYYHLLSGVDLPLKSQDEIHRYFEGCQQEFILVTEKPTLWDYQRISMYRFPKNWNKRLIAYINRLQQVLKVDRVKRTGMQYFRGMTWCSLTHDAVEYLVKHARVIHKICRFSSCADEVYKQFMLCNSSFKDRIYHNADGHTDDLREIDWERRVGDSPHIYTSDDYDLLVSSHRFFARKFDAQVDMKIAERISTYVKNKENV